MGVDETHGQDWLTTKQAAAWLGVQVPVVLHAINEGALRAYRPGQRNIKVLRSDLEAYLESRVVQPGSVVASGDSTEQSEAE